MKEINVEKEVLDILRNVTICNNVLYLPQIQLERNLYKAVDKTLNALGAKWDKKQKGHVFEYNIANQLKRVIDTGKVVDWKKATEFFFTPEEVVEEMIGNIALPCGKKLKILEPSAGQGHILDIATSNFKNSEIMCVEQNPYHCEKLIAKGYNPINDDFMNIKPTGDIDIVIMNPPFKYQVEHIKHAYDFLNKNGQLISVASSNILTNRSKKGLEFVKWFDCLEGSFLNLPDNSFKKSGTCVNTILIFLYK